MNPALKLTVALGSTQDRPRTTLSMQGRVRRLHHGGNVQRQAEKAGQLVGHPLRLADDAVVGQRQNRNAWLGGGALKLAHETGPHWRMTGQAGIASNDNAGGHAAGQRRRRPSSA